MSEVTIRPVFDRVVVEKVDFDASAHVPGLVINTTQPDDMDRGRVLAVGELYLPHGGTQAVPIQVGDVVIYKRGAGVKITSYKKNYIVLASRDVFVVETAPKETA